MIYMTCTHIHKTRSAEHLDEQGQADIKVVCCAACAAWLAENVTAFTVEVGVSVSLSSS